MHFKFLQGESNLEPASPGPLPEKKPPTAGVPAMQTFPNTLARGFRDQFWIYAPMDGDWVEVALARVLVTRPRPVQRATPLPSSSTAVTLEANDLEGVARRAKAALVVFHRWLWWISAKATTLVDIPVTGRSRVRHASAVCLKLRWRNNAETSKKNGEIAYRFS